MSGRDGGQPTGIDPFDDTAPQPPLGAHAAQPHHHEGAPGADVSPPGHHAVPAGAAAPAGRHRRRTAPWLVPVAALAALALVGAGGWALASRDAAPAPAASGSAAATAEGSTSGSPADAAPSGSSAPLPAARPTLVLGDSLGLAVYPWLADLLPDRAVTYEAEVGRSTAGTADRLEELAESDIPPVVVVSSGTNDPTAADLTAAATRILDRLGPERCVVWVDVVRPPEIGESQEALNAALDAVVAGRPGVQVLRWTALVEANPEWLTRDGIHPREAGAEGRAQAIAAAATACSPLDPDAPRAPRQILPDSAFWVPSSSGGQGSGGGSTSTRTSTPRPTSSRSATAPAPSPSPEGRTASAAPTVAAPPPPPSTPETTVPAPTTQEPAPTAT